jgi:hypothetical protein
LAPKKQSLGCSDLQVLSEHDMISCSTSGSARHCWSKISLFDIYLRWVLSYLSCCRKQRIFDCQQLSHPDRISEGRYASWRNGVPGTNQALHIFWRRRFKWYFILVKQTSLQNNKT